MEKLTPSNFAATWNEELYFFHVNSPYLTEDGQNELHSLLVKVMYLQLHQNPEMRTPRDFPPSFYCAVRCLYFCDLTLTSVTSLNVL